MNAYEVLKIKKSATEGQIKKAYRDIAKKQHPDKTKSKSLKATPVMLQIQEAYTTLLNPFLRKLHNVLLEKVNVLETCKNELNIILSRVRKSKYSNISNFMESCVSETEGAIESLNTDLKSIKKKLKIFDEDMSRIKKLDELLPHDVFAYGIFRDEIKGLLADKKALSAIKSSYEKLLENFKWYSIYKD